MEPMARLMTYSRYMLLLAYTLNSYLMMQCVMAVPQTNISEIYSAYINRVDFISSSITEVNIEKIN
jgi:hypothetical protein